MHYSLLFNCQQPEYD